MKKRIAAFSLVALTVLASCGGNTGNKEENSNNKEFSGQVLNIYNCEDYICDSDDETGVVGIIDGFEELTGCTVNYYTYDTNETMYNQFTLQKMGTYDLMCPSEYAIQKLLINDYLLPIDYEKIPNYAKYASPELRNRLKNMTVNVTTKEGEEVRNLDDYAVGYMWGTLGIIYDPEYIDREDVKSWDVFWNEKYHKQIQVKNSMRDTYVVGIMHAYKEELLKYKEQNDNGSLSDEDYNGQIQRIFDLHTPKDIEMVKNQLIDLKSNIYGFEVDSGKNDIITGKAKMSLAWSGDAVYSIDCAAEQADKVLEYAIPEEGSNIWYDGWVMPKGANKELAEAFLNYISDPENAAKNMDYIGYTPFIGGDQVFDLAVSYYGYYEFDENEEWSVDDYVMTEDKYYVCIKDTNGETISVTNTEYFEEVEDEIPVPYDLSYFFSGTIDGDAIIYPTPGSQNQLECQYPSEEQTKRLANMNDFGEANSDVIIMWSQVKASTNMVPYYVFLGGCLLLIIGLVLFKFIKNRRSLRYKRRKMTLKK